MFGFVYFTSQSLKGRKRVKFEHERVNRDQLLEITTLKLEDIIFKIIHINCNNNKTQYSQLFGSHIEKS